MNSRLLKLKKMLQDKKLDSVLVSSIPNIIYLTNFSHFTDVEREGFLLITKNANYIITDGRYSEAVKKIIKDFKLLETSSSLSLTDALKKIAVKQKLTKVGIEENNLTVTEYKKFKMIFKKLENFNLSQLRITKSEDEIEKIEKACKIGDLAYSHILKKLRINVTEKEIASELEFFIKSKNATLSFDSIVAFGSNSSIPHHKTSDQKLKKNQIVLLDFGVKSENYCSDMTRTIFFGKATQKQKMIYQTVFEAQQKAIDALKPNIKASKIDSIARKHIISKNFPNIPHSLGHGIGLEVHEQPRLSPTSHYVLKEGMIFSVEPGIYLPEFGGVRIEDLVLLTKNGAEMLTHSPKQLIKL